MNARELTGRERTHVTGILDPPCVLHREVVAPFLALRAAAAAQGIDLVPVSSFRDFDTQVRIWNGKFCGERALFDRDGRELKASTLGPQARVDAILCWSAMPGASRHHWGSEIDVIDRAALAPGDQVRLVPEEYSAGPFMHLDRWLSANLASFGFFRPYTTDRGGVAPEPWHLSYAAVSVPALRQLTEELLREVIVGAPIEGKEVLLERLAQLRHRYVSSIDEPLSA